MSGASQEEWIEISNQYPAENDFPVTVYEPKFGQWTAWSLGEVAVQNYGITHWKMQGPNPDGTLPCDIYSKHKQDMAHAMDESNLHEII